MTTAKKGFNRTTSESAAAVAAAAQEFGNDDKSRVKLRDGLSVFYLVPAVGSTPYPIRFCLIHYKPFHICGRDMAYDPTSNKTKTDSMFSKCPRCKAAWDERSKHIEKGVDASQFTNHQKLVNKKFKSDMSSERAVLQVVDLSPFFALRDGDAEPDMKMVKAWWGSFLDVMSGAPVPEDMPKELVEAAQAGPSLLAVNIDLGKRLDSLYRRAVRDEGQDPCFMPQSFLLSIQRTKGEKADGIQKYDYNVSTVSEKVLARQGWGKTIAEDEERFMETLAERAMDMTDPEPAEDTLEAKAYALIKFTPDQLNAYLAERKHTYTMTLEKKEDGDGSDDGSEALEQVGQDIDDADVSTKSGELADARAAFKRKRAEKEG